jgi:hypothetical protein
MRQPKKLAVHERVDLEGQRFGKLHVKKFAGRTVDDGYCWMVATAVSL